ncbi:MAG: lysophospholipid acyltransferase family protein [Bacteroidales bacterium]|nr:lysophospholipid acyltransferase family protein [Bacteroidales bacterium]
MKFLAYIFTNSFVWLLHLLPERFLYLISDLLYLLMYQVVGYRKKVVYENLEKAFPEFDKPGRKRIAKKFYHHLSDLILESAVFPFYSESKARQRFRVKNPGLLNELHGKGKMVMAVLGHYGNWEYLSSLGLSVDYPVVAIYKPLRNSYFDRMVQKNRKTYGVIPVPMNQIARRLIEFNKNKKAVLTLFLGDQRPQYHQIHYWTKFMGRDTPMFLGTEKLARKLDAAVVFLKIRKLERGRYEMEAELICEEPGDLKTFEITDRHVRILEDLIREEPAHWLWSHRRWKHSYEKYRQEHGE